MNDRPNDRQKSSSFELRFFVCFLFRSHFAAAFYFAFASTTQKEFCVADKRSNDGKILIARRTVACLFGRAGLLTYLLTYLPRSGNGKKSRLSEWVSEREGKRGGYLDGKQIHFDEMGPWQSPRHSIPHLTDCCLETSTQWRQKSPSLSHFNRNNNNCVIMYIDLQIPLSIVQLVLIFLEYNRPKQQENSLKRAIISSAWFCALLHSYCRPQRGEK